MALGLEEVKVQAQNPFAGKQLRCLYDKGTEKWWFSAVDVCAMFTDSDYDTGRKYWKQLKSRTLQRKNQLVTECYQLKMPSPDGKYYFTDVLDTKEVIYLLQIIPSSHADSFRLWLADVVANNTPVETMLVEAGAESAKEIEDYKKNAKEPTVLQHIVREKILHSL